MDRFLLQCSNWTVDVYLAFTVVAVCFGLLACDSGEPGDTGGNQPPTAVAEATPQDTTTDAEVTFDASGSTDPDDAAGSLTYDWEFGDGANGSGETTNHVYGSAGEYTAELSVSDGESSETDEVTVSITEPRPDSVAITYRPLDTDGNVLEDAEVTDGAVTGTGEFTDSVAYSTNTREVTAERDGYEDGSSTYTPENSQTVEITLAEKTAEVTVTAEALETGMELASQLTLSADGETVASGVSPLTAEVSVNVDELTVSAAEHEQESEVYADTSDTFVLEDSPLKIGQRRVAHCVNGLDNDGDGLTGIGKDENDNGFIDANDPGCTSRWDDGEPHRVFQRVSSGSSSTAFVSSADGEHTQYIVDRSFANPFPPSIQDAIGNVFLAATNKIEANQDEEGVAIMVKTGTEDNMTDTNQTAIVRDDNSVDGWRTSVFLGVRPEWFSDGKLYYKFIAVHQCQADEDLSCNGTGGDDVVLATPDHGKVVTRWIVESENVEKRASSSSSLATGSDDMTVWSTGYIQVPTENR